MDTRLTTSETVAYLRTNLRLLETRLRAGVFVEGAHVVPDIFLFHLAFDVSEQAAAVLHLCENQDLGRASYANARAATEAAIDMLILSRDPAEYDRRGAMARACELLEIEQAHERQDRADVAIGFGRQKASLTLNQTLESDARYWDKVAPMKGDLLRAAMETCRTKKTWKRHWSGLTQRERYDEVGKWQGTNEGVAEMAEFIYGALSIHSHPRLRSGARVREQAADKVSYKPNPEDTGNAALAAAAACQWAMAALLRRLEDGEFIAKLADR